MIITIVTQLVQFFGTPLEPDPRLEGVFLKTSFHIDAFLTTYVLVVLKLGPLLMKNVPPFSLKKIIVVYNVAQIVVNAYIFLLFFTIWGDLNFSCARPEAKDSPSALLKVQIHKYYLLLKYFDLVETFFFVLRKKDRQVSFLHVYHHYGILASAWTGARYFPGGQGTCVVFFNTLAHLIMYCYYLMSSISPDFQSVWWKKYVTVIQLIQHCFIFGFMSYGMFQPNCTYPTPIRAIFTCNLVFIIYLFLRFYQNTYCKKTKTR